MCKYCRDGNYLLHKNFVDDWTFNWVKEIKSLDIAYSQYNIFIDRGYLRLTDDGNCLEHGKKIKITFCPMCRKKL